MVMNLGQLDVSPSRALCGLIIGTTFRSRLAREGRKKMHLSVERTYHCLKDLARPTERVWSPTQCRPRRPMDAPTLALIVTLTLTLGLTLIVEASPPRPYL